MIIKSCFWNIGGKIGLWPRMDVQHTSSELSSMMRRRMTPLGRQAIELFYASIAGQNQNIPWVVSCRHGDITRRQRLLESLANNEMLSPTDFSMSVHNALLGVFSIATANKQMHTAIAGGNESFELGLLEAYALQKTQGGTVGYMYYDSVESQDNEKTDVCFSLLLDDSQSPGIEINYLSAGNTIEEKKIDLVNLLVNYLDNDEKRYSMHIAGGQILLARDN